MSWFDQNWGIKREKAVWILGGLIWLFGVGTVLSFNAWQDVHFLGDRTFFGSVDYLTSNIMLPLGGLLMAVFMAWVMKKEQVQAQIDLKAPWMNALMLDLKWLAPVAVLVVFSSSLVESDSVVWMIALSLSVYAIYVWNALKKEGRGEI